MILKYLLLAVDPVKLESEHVEEAGDGGGGISVLS